MPQTIQKNGWFGQNSQMGNCWGKINCTRHVRSTICKKKRNIGKICKVCDRIPTPFPPAGDNYWGPQLPRGRAVSGFKLFTRDSLIASINSHIWPALLFPGTTMLSDSSLGLTQKNDRRTINIKQVPNVVNQCCDGCSAPCNILSIDQGRFQAIL